MPDTNWTHETAGDATTSTTTSSPTTTWTNENVGDGGTTTITSTPSGTTTQEIVGSSGTATTTSSPTTTWTTETIGNHVAGGSLTIDDIKLDDNNIGHINDTDLLTLANNLFLVKGHTYIHSDYSLLTDTIRSYTTPGSIAMNLDGEDVEVVGDLAITGNNITTDVIFNQSLSVLGNFHAAAGATFAGTGAANFQGNTYILCANTTDASDNLGNSGTIRCKGGASIAKKLYVGGDLDVDGAINADNVDIDGPLQLDATLTVGVNDTGYDVKFYGATSGEYMLWDESEDCLELAGGSKLFFRDQGGEYIYSAMDSKITYTAGAEHIFDGAIQSNDDLVIGHDGDGEIFKAYGDSAASHLIYNGGGGRVNDLDLIYGDMRIKNRAISYPILDLNCTQAAGTSYGPNIRLLRGDLEAAQIGSIGPLASIRFDGMAADGTIATNGFGRIKVDALSAVKDLEMGGIIIEGCVLGGLVHAFGATPHENAHSDGAGSLNDASVHLDITIGHNLESLISLYGIVRCKGSIIQDSAGNDIIRFDGVSDQGEGEEAEILNLRVTNKCKGNFLFENTDESDTQEIEIGGSTGSFLTMSSNQAVFRMSGTEPKIRMSGATPEILMPGANAKIYLSGLKSQVIIGDANDPGGNGFLELGYASGDTADDKPGIINLMHKSGTVGGSAFLWVDSDMKLRINGTQPTGTNYDDIGTIVGTQTA